MPHKVEVHSARRQRSRAPVSPPAPKPPSNDPIERAGEEILASYKLIEDAWKKAEAKLALAHVPVECKVEVSREPIGGGVEEPPYGEQTNYLGYLKIKDQWRICFIEECEFFVGHPDEQFQTSARPITEVAVETRLEMFDWFEKLYAEVLNQTASYVPKIKDRVAQFEAKLDLIDL